MAITPARQRNAVSEGIALGLLMLDRNEIPFDKFRVDLAFEHAWKLLGLPFEVFASRHRSP